MKVLELFSGIGGMHLALKESGIDFDVIAALDINSQANTVYKHNFPEVKVIEKNVQSLTSQVLNNKLKPDMIAMSPPCQPFSRNGNRKDVDDPRTNGLLHIINLIPELTTVTHILMENVCGFELSKARNLLLEVLQTSGFFYQEFLLSPIQFEIPNSRRRYYLLARKSEPFPFPQEIIADPPTELTTLINPPFSKIGEILTPPEDLEAYKFPVASLKKCGAVLDVVNASSERSICFTGAYTRFYDGTGSVFTPLEVEEAKKLISATSEMDPETKEYAHLTDGIQLRFFTPKEVSRIMCFPESYQFPPDVGQKKLYKLLGNSINVLVVAVMIKTLCRTTNDVGDS